MKTVHILATVRKPELLPAALLVFRTLRTGFPTAKICVWGNSLDSASFAAVANECAKVNAQLRNLAATSHDAWIESLIEESMSPFWICDTDMVFWDPVEEWFSVDAGQINFAGRYEPAFHEEWTDTVHVQRLHTCLMYLNPAKVRMAMREFMSRIPSPWGNTADFPFIRQHIVPVRGRLPLFYDSCTGMYHAIESAAFTEPMNQCFEHLHCATYADALENKAFQEVHRRVYEDINAAKGLRELQEKYYLERAVKEIPKRSKGKEANAV